MRRRVKWIWELSCKDSDLMVDKQCSKAANEANKSLGVINRDFICKAKKVILPLLTSPLQGRTLITACRAGMETALQEGHRQVGEGAEESDQDSGGSE